MRQIILTILLLFPISVFGTTAGPNNCASGADVSRTATAWGSANNACVASSSTTASSIPANAGETDWLAATSFGFSIPTGATIVGIQVSFNRSGQTVNCIQDGGVYLTKTGTAAVGTNHNSATYWPTTSTAASYGSTSDLWGATWAASDINATGFGVMIYATNQNASLNKSATIYAFIQVTIAYSVPTGHSSIPGIIGQLRTQTRTVASLERLNWHVN